MRHIVSVVVMASAFLFSANIVIADENRIPLTSVEIAALAERAVPKIEVSYKDPCGAWQESWGSGVFINNHGHIITNAHIVRVEPKPSTWRDGPRPPWMSGHPVLGTDYRFTVVLPWLNKSYIGKLIWWDKYKDLAKLEVPGIKLGEFSVLQCGDSDKLRSGERVYTIGHPIDGNNTITQGIIGGLHRFQYFNYLEDDIQFDAAIEPGNSGGLLINRYGEVVGINYAQYSRRGFAIPINFVPANKKLRGEIEMDYLGLSLMVHNFPRGVEDNDLWKMACQIGTFDKKILESLLSLTENQSAIVNEKVDARSPAGKAGLMRGDIIVRFNGVAVKDGMHFRILQSGAKLEASLELKVLRVAVGDDDGTWVEHLSVIVVPDKREI